MRKKPLDWFNDLISTLREFTNKASKIGWGNGDGFDKEDNAVCDEIRRILSGEVNDAIAEKWARKISPDIFKNKAVREGGVSLTKDLLKVFFKEAVKAN